MKTITIPIEFSIKEVIKRSEEAPCGMWVLQTAIDSVFYLMESPEIKTAILYDSNWEAINYIKPEYFGLSLKELI